MSGVLLLVTTGFTLFLYHTQREDSLAQIDRELRAFALMANTLLPPGYHDGIRGRDSVSQKEYHQIVDRFNRVCKAEELEYLWSLMVVDGRIVFTSATSPSKDVNKNDHAEFFEPHSNPEFYTNAFATMKPQFQINEDKWGRIRAALIPMRDSEGRPFLVCASRSMNQVERQMRATLLSSVALGIGMMLLGVLASLVLARSLSHPIEQLTVAAAAVSGGDLSRGVHVHGALELEILGDSLNKMIENLSRDMADRELAEEALRESEHRYRMLLDTAPASIMVIRKGVFVFCNSFAARNLGYDSPASMIGQPVFDSIAAESREALSLRFQNLNGNNAGTLIEIRVLDRFGGSRWVETASLPIRFHGEQAALVIGVDITERKQADLARQRLEREIIEISEREQSRLGRDLHDDLGQQLVGIRLMIEALEMKIEHDKESAVVLARQTSGLIRQTILSTRNLARGLYPVDLVRLGLQDSLKELAVRTAELTGMRCITRMNPRFLSASAALIHLYRIVQEALSNALRHGRPTHVIIRCAVIRGVSAVQVLNDGIPFTEPQPEKRGMGLDIFNYRAEMIGAKLTVRRGRRGGCIVTCLLLEKNLTPPES